MANKRETFREGAQAFADLPADVDPILRGHLEEVHRKLVGTGLQVLEERPHEPAAQAEPGTRTLARSAWDTLMGGGRFGLGGWSVLLDPTETHARGLGTGGGREGGAGQRRTAKPCGTPRGPACGYPCE